jgi:hypothetical protein
MENEKIEISKNDLICSICKEPFIEPIFIPSCGHHSCRDCLIQLTNSNIDNNRKCSVCLVPFDEIMNNDYLNKVKSNYMLSNLVFEHFSVKCENKGCSIKILESQQDKHNKKCPYFIINCKNKNNGCYEKFMRKDEFEHQKLCRFNICVGKRYGCNYRNSLSELEMHQKDCIYKRIGKNIENKLIENMTCYVEEKINDVIDENNKKEKDMLFKIKSLERSVSALKKRIYNNYYYNYNSSPSYRLPNYNYNSNQNNNLDRNPYRVYNYDEQPVNNEINQNDIHYDNETIIDNSNRDNERNQNNTSNTRNSVLNNSMIPLDIYNNNINSINRNLTNTITQILENDLNDILRNNIRNNIDRENLDRNYSTFNNDNNNSTDEGEAM